MSTDTVTQRVFAPGEADVSATLRTMPAPRINPATVAVAVDVGAHRLSAVVAMPDGRRLPLLLEGATSAPAGVFVEPGSGHLLAGSAARVRGLEQPSHYITDIPSNIDATELIVGNHLVAGVDLYAAVLRLVAEETQRLVGNLTMRAVIVIAPQWGPRRRALAQEASRRAGFVTTSLVSAPAALAAAVGTTPAHHDRAATTSSSCTLVCDAGASAMTLTVLQDDAGRTEQLATAVVPDAAGHDIDTAILGHTLPQPDHLHQPALHEAALHQAAVAAGVPSTTWLTDAARLAKEDLQHRHDTAIAWPAPYPVTTFDRDQLTALLEPVADRLAAAVTDILSAADIDRAHLNRVILAGGGAHLPGLRHALTVTTGREPIVPTNLDTAAPYGALTATGHTPDRAVRPTPVPALALTPQQIFGTLVMAAASLVLVAFALMTMWTWETSGTITYVKLSTELISAGAAVAMLAAYAAAQLVPVAAASGADPRVVDHRTTAALARRSYTVAAAFGVTVATFYGLAVGSLVGETSTEYLSAALRPAIPLTVLALLIALLVGRMDDRVAAWLVAARPAIIPVVAATLGILAMHYAFNTTTHVPGGTGLLARLGGAAVGAGIAATITRQPVIKLIAVVVGALGCFVVVSLDNITAITVGYVAAIIWWALPLAGRAVTTAFPRLAEASREVLAPLARPARPQDRR